MVLHNPNNWHWVNKDCLEWSREYFTNNLVGTKAENKTSQVEISSVKTVEGDVEVCQRKGKIISLFDVKIALEFNGKENEEPVEGKISIPEVSYDSDLDDYQFNIEVVKGSDDVKALVRKSLVPILREKLHKFGIDLIQTHGGEIQHSGNEPIHYTQNKIVSNTSVGGGDDAKDVGLGSSQSGQPSAFGVQAYNTTTVEVQTTFTASPEQIYNVLTDPQQVSAWSRSAPNETPKVNGQFQLFGGSVQGKYTILDENKKICQDWRLRDWKHGHYAKLTHTITPLDNETKLLSVWEGIPVGREEAVKSNFKNYYTDPIKATFGYGLLDL